MFEDWIRGGRGRRGGRGMRGGRGEEEKEVNAVGDIMFIVGGKILLFARFLGSDF
jgi:hypothetical protein